MTATTEPKRTLYDKFLDQAREPQKYPIFEIGIPMRDGVELAATVFLPHARATSAGDCDDYSI